MANPVGRPRKERPPPNPRGRPLKYTDPQEVSDIIDDYFLTDAYTGEEEHRIYNPTMSGLAYALDLSRQGLLDYSNKDDFYDTIKKARLKVEIALEQRLANAAPAGTIFNLKNNFGWKDKTETEMTGANGSALIPTSIKIEYE